MGRATARSNLAREPQVDIGAWTQRLQGFQLAEDHTHDPTLELPRQLLPLMTAALSAQADRFLTGDAGTRSQFPDVQVRRKGQLSDRSKTCLYFRLVEILRLLILCRARY